MEQKGVGEPELRGKRTENLAVAEAASLENNGDCARGHRGQVPKPLIPS